MSYRLHNPWFAEMLLKSWILNPWAGRSIIGANAHESTRKSNFEIQRIKVLIYDETIL